MKSYISAAAIFAALLVTIPAAPLAVTELRASAGSEPPAAVSPPGGLRVGHRVQHHVLHPDIIPLPSP